MLCILAPLQVKKILGVGACRNVSDALPCYAASRDFELTELLKV